MDVQGLDRSALIVVDVQNDFCPGGALAVPGGDEIIPIINSLMPLFGHVALTQDWHPQGHSSFASTHGKAPFSLDEGPDRLGMLWPDHCVAGSRGADFHPGLRTDLARLILRKGTRKDLDSYSAFFENDGHTSTGLSGWLAALKVSAVYVLGLATDYCVRATAVDAANLGLEVWVLTEACRPVSPQDERIAVEAMKSAGCSIASIYELRSR